MALVGKNVHEKWFFKVAFYSIFAENKVGFGTFSR